MKQYIEFTLGTENYVIEMSYVREISEIIRPSNITKLVGAPEFDKGVSKVVSKVRNDVISEAHEPRIIILEFNSKNVGLLVDDFVNILESDNIKNMPSLIHLDLERLFSSDVTQGLNSETFLKCRLFPQVHNTAA